MECMLMSILKVTIYETNGVHQNARFDKIFKRRHSNHENRKLSKKII